jgi:spore coat protein U-like protein
MVGLFNFLALSYATSCEVSVSHPINFGDYNPFANKPTYGVGKIKISCDGATRYKVGLLSGNANSPDGRYMVNAQGDKIYYNLYLGPGYHTVWGNGPNALVAEQKNNHRSREFYLYGKIPPHQNNASVGNYHDNIPVEISY